MRGNYLFVVYCLLFFYLSLDDSRFFTSLRSVLDQSLLAHRSALHSASSAVNDHRPPSIAKPLPPFVIIRSSRRHNTLSRGPVAESARSGSRGQPFVPYIITLCIEISATSLTSHNIRRDPSTMGSPLPPNPYKTLNVAQDASLATIRSAHRKLVLTCHPDKFQDEAVKVQKQEQFHQVQQAYEILSDETRRQRYDEKVKLAELRAEMMKEKGGSRIPQEYASRVVPEFSARPRPSPTYEMRGDRLYEERVPSRPYEEDVFSTNFHEPRPAPRKYDERYSPPTSRRSSARVSEEKRRPREDEDRYVYTKHTAKAAEKSTKHSQEKKKDKDKRKDREAKFTSKSPYMEEYDSDSDPMEHVHVKATSKHRHDDVRRRDREEPRRSSRREISDHTGRLDIKTQHAEDYIKQKRESAPYEVETRRPSLATRTFSTAEFETRPSHPSAPPMTPVDSVRRSSGRTREARKGSPVRLTRRATEIVDPPPRRPTMPGISSDPRPLNNMIPKKDPLRSSTMSILPEGRLPSMRRSDTMTVEPGPRRAETLPNKSKFKNPENDSGYSSPDTPEQYSAPKPSLGRTKTYHVSHDEDDPRRHHIITVDPEEIGDRDRERDRDRDRNRDRDRDRDISPRSRRQTDRPVMAARPSSNARGPPTRANTFSFPPESVPSPREPPFTRTESNRVPPLQSRQQSRGSHQLFGEYLPEEPYKVVHESPRIRSNDISYSRRSPGEASPDSYPYSHFPRHRPNLARNEKAY